jgi:hypothetical protein
MSYCSTQYWFWPAFLFSFVLFFFRVLCGTYDSGANEGCCFLPASSYLVLPPASATSYLILPSRPAACYFSQVRHLIAAVVVAVSMGEPQPLQPANSCETDRLPALLTLAGSGVAFFNGRVDEPALAGARYCLLLLTSVAFPTGGASERGEPWHGERDPNCGGGRDG